jgi:hypothetical protein
MWNCDNNHSRISGETLIDGKEKGFFKFNIPKGGGNKYCDVSFLK